MTNEGSQPCEYDDNGNMTRRGSLYLKYNPENQMAKASSDSGGSVYVARFACDGDGKRAKRVDNYGTVHYVQPHYERNVGTGADTTEVITRYYFAQMGKMRRLIPIRRGGTLYYVVPNHLGGTLRVVNTSGATTDDIRYHAFGGTRSGGTNLQTDKRFTGQILDQSTGLYWYASRAYDPALCRLTQPDTIIQDYSIPQTLNRYSYALNNPVKYNDPTGHFLPLLAMGIGAVVGGAVGVAGYAAMKVATGQSMKWEEAGIAAAVGAASGAVAPVVAMAATSTFVAGALTAGVGAAANTIQYAATQWVNDEPMDLWKGMFAAVTGAGGGLIGGVLTREAVEGLAVPISEYASWEFVNAATDYITEQAIRGLPRAFFGAAVSNVDAEVVLGEESTYSPGIELSETASGYEDIAFEW